ncbi:MAG: hypothetical protein GY679_03325 [Mycoplasma sp.]|nr:hypothetical protein [Mycoplasma sp.]
MKIRIIGTSLKKYIDNFLIIKSYGVPYFRIERDEEPKLLDEQDNVILKFNGDNATLKQNIEAWEVMGLVQYKQFKHRLSKIKNNVMEHIKENLCKKQNDPKLDAMRLGYLILIQHSSNRFTDDLIKVWKINQFKGELNSEKLDKQCNSFYKELIEDKVFLAKVRKEIYNEINKEL